MNKDYVCNNRKCRYHDTTMIMHCARSISAEDDRPYALACRAYNKIRERPIKMQLLAAEQELKDFSALFDLQHKRSVEADKLWQHDTGEQYRPDLGELLRYFMAQRDLLDRFYWLLREGGYASDEYDDLMESYERKDFCRSNTGNEAR